MRGKLQQQLFPVVELSPLSKYHMMERKTDLSVQWVDTMAPVVLHLQPFSTHLVPTGSKV